MRKEGSSLEGPLTSHSVWCYTPGPSRAFTSSCSSLTGPTLQTQGSGWRSWNSGLEGPPSGQPQSLLYPMDRFRGSRCCE